MNKLQSAKPICQYVTWSLHVNPDLLTLSDHVLGSILCHLPAKTNEKVAFH